MANVLFKRGLQKDLPSSVIDGAFYLTTDTHRLYVGQSDGTKAILNQTIQFVADLTELNTLANGWTAEQKAAHKNDIYYVVGSSSATDGNGKTGQANILATWDGNHWVQINPDTNTKVESFTFAPAMGSGDDANTAIVELRILDNATHNSSTTAIKDNFKVSGAHGILVSVNGTDKEIHLEGDTYTLDSGVTGSGTPNATAEITLKSAHGQGNSTVSISQGQNVFITENADNDGFIIEADDTYVNQVSNQITDGKLITSISSTGSDNSGKTSTKSSTAIDLFYTVNGVSQPINTALDVYSKGQIDEKFRKLDGLTYCGTIGNQGEYTLDVANGYVPKDGSGNILEVHNGDMFLISVNESTVEYAPGKVAGNGDLLIATGEEDTAGKLTDITWTYVPSGNDVTTDTTYSFTTDAGNNEFKITGSTSPATSGAIKLAAGTATTVSSAATTEGAGNQKLLTVTVGHADVAHEATTGTALTQRDSFNAVTGVTVNSQGHVTDVTTTNIGISTYAAAVMQLASATVANKSAITLTPGLSKNGSVTGSYVNGNATTIESSSLTLTASGNNLDIDIVWGTF